ncbi:NAD(P)-binding protein [Parathielavia appendiculata]|uniref:NAD(P)-binding protein n=1 Tax=Parathielavia appendiculata TaxID=2587402 RepID=A0AAN6Z6P8_9PEZI|nr:NAD(P)-binding protein [Parathielavia appendiculata]
MPLQFLASVYFDGLPPWFPDPMRLLRAMTTLTAVVLTKWYASGRVNLSERNMHGRVVLMTGGTSGIGAATALELARRGAQLVLLTRQPPSDPFLVEYVDDLRARSGNRMIYAEQVDLADLYSVRQFATRWIDNAPPRRLDMVVLCASTLVPPGGERVETAEGVELTWMVNFLANFHLLGILSPAIRAQPFDREVRIIVPTCSSYIASPKLDEEAVVTGGRDDLEDWVPGRAYARSKLAMMVFAKAYQKHLDAYKRPDELPMNARVVLVDPGLARTVSMRRWLTRGSLWGLLLYLVFYFFAWLFLKSPHMAAQSVLYAAMDGSLGRGAGGRLIKECMEVDCARKDVDDEEVAKKLWESSDRLIERVEKEQAVKRARAKKEQEKKEQEAKEAAQVQEIEALVGAIKKGKSKEASKKNTKKAEFTGNTQPELFNPSHCHPVFFTAKLRRPPFNVLSGAQLSPVAYGYVYQDAPGGSKKSAGPRL